MATKRSTNSATARARKPRSDKGKSRRNWKPIFLTAFAKSGTVTAACRAAKIDRKTAYNARQADEAFAVAWFEVEEGVTEKLEEEGLKRALEGSDRMLEFFLRARRPSMYRDNLKVEHGGQVSIDSEAVERRIESLMEELGA